MPIAVPNKLGRAGITPAASPSPLAVPDFVGVGERINRSVQPSGLSEALASLTGVGAAVYQQVEGVRKQDEANAGLAAAGETIHATKTPQELALALRKKLSDSTLSPEFRVAYRELAAGELAKRYDVAVQAEMDDAITKAGVPDPKTGLYPDPPEAEVIQNRVWQQIVGGADAAHLKSVFFRGALQANAGASNAQTAEAYRRSVKDLQTKNAEALFANTAATHFGKLVAESASPEDAAAAIKALLPQYGSEAHASGFRDPRGLVVAAIRTTLSESGRKSPEAALTILDSLDEAEIAGVALKNDVKVGPAIQALRNELEVAQRRQEARGSESNEKRRAEVTRKIEDFVGGRDLSSKAEYDAAVKAVMDPESTLFASSGERDVAMQILSARRHNAVIYANADVDAIKQAAGVEFNKTYQSGGTAAVAEWLKVAPMPDAVRVELTAKLREMDTAAAKAGYGPGSVADSLLDWSLRLTPKKAETHKEDVKAYQTALTDLKAALATENPEAIKTAKAALDARMAKVEALRSEDAVKTAQVQADIFDTTKPIPAEAEEFVSPAALASARYKRRVSAEASVSAAAKRALQPIRELFNEAENTTSRGEDYAAMRHDGDAEFESLQRRLDALRNDYAMDDPVAFKAQVDSIVADAKPLHDRLRERWTGVVTESTGPLFTGLPYATATEKAALADAQTTIPEGMIPSRPVTKTELQAGTQEISDGNILDLNGLGDDLNNLENTAKALSQLRAGNPVATVEQSRAAYKSIAEVVGESDPVNVSNAIVLATIGRYVPLSAFVAGKVGDAPYAVTLDPKDPIVSKGLQPNRTLLFQSAAELQTWEAAYKTDDPQTIAERDAFLNFKGWSQGGNKHRLMMMVLQAQRNLLGMPEGVSTPQPPKTEGAGGAAPAAESKPTAESQPAAPAGATETRPETGTASKPTETPKAVSGAPKAGSDRAAYLAEARSDFPLLKAVMAAKDTQIVQGFAQVPGIFAEGFAQAWRTATGAPDPAAPAPAPTGVKTPGPSLARLQQRRAEALASTEAILQEAQEAGVRIADFMALRPLSIYRPDKLRWQPLHSSLTETELDYFRRLNLLRAAFDDE